MKYVKETTWNVVEEVSVRTLLERYKAANNDRHCMDGLAILIDNEQYDLETLWQWLASVDANRKYLIVDKNETVTTTYMT